MKTNRNELMKTNQTLEITEPLAMK